VTVAAAGALALGTADVANATVQSWYPATVGGANSGGGVSLRDCYHPSVHLPPSTSCTYVKTVPTGTAVNIVCQRAGQNISGDPVWDYVVYSGGEGYMSDYYLFTGHDNWIPGVDVCQ
jgi:hypothetical protein